MSEREVVLDEPTLFDEQADAVRQATDRAERAEAELAKLKHATAHKPAAHPAAPASAPDRLERWQALKNPPSPSSAKAAQSDPEHEMNLADESMPTTPTRMQAAKLSCARIR